MSNLPSEKGYTDNHAHDVVLRYHSFGDPKHPPVVLIMGLALQSIHWDNSLCQAIADHGYWVIRFDNRDVGKSTKLKHLGVPKFSAIALRHWLGRKFDAPYGLSDMAEDTLRLMDHLSIKRAHLVGVSMGGMIAQIIAIEAPERVKSLTSVMSTTGGKKLPKPSLNTTLTLITPFPKDTPGYVRQSLKLWRTLHGKHYKFNPDKVATVSEHAHKRSYHPSGVLRQMAAIMAAEDRTAALNKLKVPCLVIHGTEDPLLPFACGLATANSIEGATMMPIEGMGHTLPEEAVGDILTRMLDHFSSVESGATDTSSSDQS